MILTLNCINVSACRYNNGLCFLFCHFCVSVYIISYNLVAIFEAPKMSQASSSTQWQVNPKDNSCVASHTGHLNPKGCIYKC